MKSEPKPGRKYRTTNPHRIVTLVDAPPGPFGWLPVQTEDGSQEYVPKGELVEMEDQP